MAGHSKWDNIKHRKAAQDAVRSKEFMKLAKEIFVAAQKGIDPDSNANLRLAISKAKSKSMPSRNIKKAIDKASGNKEIGAEYKEYLYEGYLPGGISVLVYCLSNNHNRLAANVKSLFNKSGGSIAKTGSVSYLFNRIGIIKIDKTMSEDELMEIIINHDPEDVKEDDSTFTITCPPASFQNIKNALENKGINEFHIVEIKHHANSFILLDEEKSHKVLKAIEKFEDNEDIQEVFHNLKI